MNYPFILDMLAGLRGYIADHCEDCSELEGLTVCDACRDKGEYSRHHAEYQALAHDFYNQAVNDWYDNKILTKEHQLNAVSKLLDSLEALSQKHDELYVSSEYTE